MKPSMGFCRSLSLCQIIKTVAIPSRFSPWYVKFDFKLRFLSVRSLCKRKQVDCVKVVEQPLPGVLVCFKPERLIKTQMFYHQSRRIIILAGRETSQDALLPECRAGLPEMEGWVRRLAAFHHFCCDDVDLNLLPAQIPHLAHLRLVEWRHI